jgi:urea carboxylase system permease
MTQQVHEGSELSEFGYKQELDRTLGKFATFAAGISYISILTGTFQLFYLGFGLGGPAYWWSWPMVFFGQLMVALCFAELAAHYPVAGSIYNWAKRLSTPTVSWLAGWMMLTASIVTIAAVALAYQLTLPQIWSGFQIVGDGSGKYDVSTNAVILGTILIIFTTAVNALGVKLMAQINSSGVFIELVAAVLLVIAFFLAATRGPDVVLETQGRGDGRDLGYLGAFLAASIASLYVMYGFDTASSLGEETKDPRSNAPKAILRALIASFVIGGLILLGGMMAVGNINAEELSTVGLQYIVLDVFGSTVGKLFLISVVIAITVCCLAVYTAAIRMMFAMARDNNLPAGTHLARVDPVRKTPIIPAVLIGSLAVLILLINIRQTQIIAGVTSLGIAMIYIAYLLVTVPMLVGRLRGRWPQDEEKTRGYFSLGRWGLPVNLLAVVWGATMTINLMWPRREIFNAVEPFHWYVQWIAVLFIGTVFFGGLAYYWLVQRHKTGVLSDHAWQEQVGESESPATAGLSEPRPA